MGLEEEIEALREEISDTPYNKSTESHIGRLKAKLAEKKEKLQNQSSAGGGEGYAVEKTGDATVALVGFPSVGKSTLFNALTDAESEVGEYEFTTLNVNPGMLQYNGGNIQLLDVPGLIEGAADGRGGGRKSCPSSAPRTSSSSCSRSSKSTSTSGFGEELYENKIRLDYQPPSISIAKKGRGGISVTSSADQDSPRTSSRKSSASTATSTPTSPSARRWTSTVSSTASWTTASTSRRWSR